MHVAPEKKCRRLRRFTLLWWYGVVIIKICSACQWEILLDVNSLLYYRVGKRRIKFPKRQQPTNTTPTARKDISLMQQQRLTVRVRETERERKEYTDALGREQVVPQKMAWKMVWKKKRGKKEKDGFDFASGFIVRTACGVQCTLYIQICPYDEAFGDSPPRSPRHAATTELQN